MGASSAALTPSSQPAASQRRHYSCVVRAGDMYTAFAVRSPMTAACSVPKSLVPLLLLLALFAYEPAEALQCYDCLTLALPACMNSSVAREADKIPCKPDEIYCSVLIMNDSVGRQIISRQCASRVDEGEQLMVYISASHDKPLKLVKFVTCRNDLCNNDSQDNASGRQQDASLHGGSNTAGVSSAANKPSNGSAVSLLATPLAILGVMAVGMATADILRSAA